LRQQLNKPRTPFKLGFNEVFAYSHRALKLVWTTNPTLTLLLACLTVIAGVMPAAIAYVGATIVDAVLSAIQQAGSADSRQLVIERVLLEGILVASLAGAQRC
jgi:ATP-binding cassette subfamily B protein